jgi:hypothetical protein
MTDAGRGIGVAYLVMDGDVGLLDQIDDRFETPLVWLRNTDSMRLDRGTHALPFSGSPAASSRAG